MKILSIQVGKPTTVEYQGRLVTTAIFKSEVAGPVMLRTYNLDGDGQADLKVHGGRDKALYAYSFDTYKEWRALRPQDAFESGAFGENLCMESLDEKTIYVGDTFALGAAVVQVTEPRFPCSKLVVKFKDPGILKQFLNFERPGIYFRVLQEGLIHRGDELRLLARESSLVSVWEVFHAYLHAPAPAELIARALKVNAMSEAWRERFMEMQAAKS